MRGFFKGFAIAAMLVGMMAVSTMAVYASNIRLDVHGEEIMFEGQSPAIVDGRTLVPVRGVFEALGFDIGWDGEAQRVTLVREADTITIYIGQDSFWLNGTTLGLDVPAQIINGSTMLPIRALAESIGYNVDVQTSSTQVNIFIFSVGRIEAEILQRLNGNREVLGYALLTLDLDMVDLARMHAVDMAQNDLNSVRGSDGSYPEQRMQRTLDLVDFHERFAIVHRRIGAPVQIEDIAERVVRGGVMNSVNIRFSTLVGVAVEYNEGVLYVVVNHGSPAPRDSEEFNQRMLTAINNERQARGLRTLHLDAGLMSAVNWAVTGGRMTGTTDLETWVNRPHNISPEHLAYVFTSSSSGQVMRPDITQLGIGRGYFLNPHLDTMQPRTLLILATPTERPAVYWLSTMPVSPTTLPNRRLTQAERNAWISEYEQLGGASAFELEVLRLVNEVRVSYGLNALQANESLMYAARFYAQTLSNLDLPLGHREGPYGGSRATAEVFVTSLERGPSGQNGIGGIRTPQNAVDRWMNSPGHRANILRPNMTYIGVGMYGNFGYMIVARF